MADKYIGDFSFSAIAVRTLALGFFSFLHPFTASIINEAVDTLDIPLSGISHPTGNLRYQIPDKILDQILYGAWLLIAVFSKNPFQNSSSVILRNFKWILATAYAFRTIGIYLFVSTTEEHYLTLFPNFFIFWFFLFYAIDYFNLQLNDDKVLIVLLAITGGLKFLHEVFLREKPPFFEDFVDKQRKKDHSSSEEFSFRILTFQIIFLVLLILRVNSKA